MPWYTLQSNLICISYQKEDRDLRFTWKQFNERVDDMARGLIAIGVTKGTHVGLWAQNVPDWLTFLYACAKIGAVCITVNTNYKQNELEYLCQDSDMHTLCLTDGTWESNYVDMAYTMLPELRECQRGHLESKRFPRNTAACTTPPRYCFWVRIPMMTSSSVCASQ